MWKMSLHWQILNLPSEPAFKTLKSWLWFGWIRLNSIECSAYPWSYRVSLSRQAELGTATRAATWRSAPLPSTVLQVTPAFRSHTSPTFHDAQEVIWRLWSMKQHLTFDSFGRNPGVLWGHTGLDDENWYLCPKPQGNMTVRVRKSLASCAPEAWLVKMHTCLPAK